MIDKEEKDIRNTRLRLYDLCKSFFLDQPDATILSRWRGTFSALTKERIAPGFDKSVQDIHKALEKGSLEDIQNEFYSLFVNPFGDGPISSSASYYLDGKPYSETLVKLRGILLDLGLAKTSEVTQEEDTLVVLLDIMTRLIEEEQHSDGGQDLQAELISEYLIPLGHGMKKASETNQSAQFYLCCCSFLNEFLALEQAITKAAASPMVA